jgi:hypothetical protein
MNYTLEQLRQLAGQRDSSGRLATVILHKRQENKKNGRIIWSQTNPIAAKVAYKNLSLEYAKRPGGWKNIFLEKQGEAAFVPSFKLDQNPLSDLNLIEQLSNLGFELKPKEVAPVVELNPVKSVEKSLSDYTDEELLEYLKSKGSVHGKVKLKGESEEPVQTEPTITEQPELNNAQNETGATA